MRKSPEPWVTKMFLARRPSRQTIERFAEESRRLPLSYDQVGIAGASPADYDLDETIVTIGHGEASFERAKAALAAWKHFDIHWVEIRLHRPAFGFAYGTLVNHVEQGEEIFEVSLRPETHEVVYRIRAVSRPRAVLARLGYPAVRMFQARFRRDSGEAMRRAVNERGA
jgi:uncharacterized protein (UPF0548 family)